MATVENVVWADENAEMVLAIIDGTDWQIPAESIAARNGELPSIIADWLDGGNVIGSKAMTTADVNKERERRLLQFEFNAHTYQGDQNSRATIQAMGNAAMVAFTGGASKGDLRWFNPKEDFYFIDVSNNQIPMDAETCWLFARTAVMHQSTIMTSARKLKDMQPIPSDFADDKYWKG